MLQITEPTLYFYPEPCFSWTLAGDEDQVSYEISVFTKAGKQIYTTGKIVNANRHNITCDVNLEPEDEYSYSITVTGSAGTEVTCQGDLFCTGVVQWRAQWLEPNRERKPLADSTAPVEPVAHGATVGDALDRIDPVTYWRKTFQLDELPELALAYASARGIYTLYINGVAVSDLYAPGNTSYHKHIDYQVYDVTSQLRIGENVMAFALADGWYTGKIGAVGIGQQFGTENALIGQLMLRDHSGTKTYITTDEEMRWSEGPLRYSDLYIGEYYDENHEIIGWNTAEDAQGTSWQKGIVKAYETDTLILQNIPGIRVVREIEPKILFTEKGDMLLDAGENIVGYVSFELDMKKSEIVSLEHSETVDKDGNYLQNIIGQNKDQTDYFKAGSDGVKRFAPQFSFHGFRYVRVKGTRDCDASHYKIHVIATPLRSTGSFFCSDERVNLLQENIKRSQEGNMISIPTDCPQRERTGWLGDMQVYAPTGCYEYDIEAFLRHWMVDVKNDQLPNGEVPHIVPYMPSHDIMKPPGIEGVSAAGWSDAAVIVPWRLYEAYGDIRILQENFDLMKTYMDSTEIRVAELPDNYEQMPPEEKARQPYLWNTGFQYGDWLMPSIQMSGRSIFEVVLETGHVVATLMYAMTTKMMAEICGILGDEVLKRHYLEINEKVRAAFAEEYVNPDGTIKKDYQGVYVLALQVRAIPEHLRSKATARLVQLIHENNNLLDTGFLSVAYLLPVLKENGQRELANTLFFRDECPSWLYEIKMGATTMWEYWNGYSEDGTPSDCSMNHFAFGCVGEYMFRDIVGIKATEPGFGRVCIQPDIACGLNFVKGSYDSVWGRYEVSWKLESEKVLLDLTVPPNARARVCVKTMDREFTCGTYHLSI